MMGGGVDDNVCWVQKMSGVGRFIFKQQITFTIANSHSLNVAGN
jgi:hypothetical protein